MGPRPRRPMWLRVVRVFIALVALVVLLIAGGFLTLHTDWARDKVRGVLVQELGKRLNGIVTVGRLEGDLLDAVTARDIEVRDKSGKLVMRADSLALDYRLLPLLDNHFHADILAIDGLELELRRLPDGRLAVADLWIEQPPGGAPWTTTLASIEVTRSSVRLESEPGKWDELTGLDLEAAVTTRPEATHVTLAALGAEWKNRQLPLAVAGDLRIPQAGGLLASGLQLSVGHTHVVVPQAAWGPSARYAAFAADVSAAELARVWPDSPLLVDASLGGFATQDPTSELARAHVFGGADKASLSLWAEVGRAAQSGKVALFWTGLAPHEIVKGAPEGRLDGWVTGDVAGLKTPWPPDAAALSGSVRAGARGRLLDSPMTDLSIDAKVSQRRLEGQARASVTGGKAEVELAALLPNDLQELGEIALERADATAQMRDVAPLASAFGQQVRGPLSVELRASGRLDSLTARARVVSAGITQKQLRVAGVRADLRVRNANVRNLPGAATGQAEVHLDSIVNAGKRYGNAHVIASLADRGRRAEVRFDGGGKNGISARGALSAQLGSDSARVTFRELRVVTRKLVWQGRGGRLAVTDGGRVISGDLALSSQAGSLRIGADITRRGRRLHGPVRWQVSKIDLARVMAELGQPPMRGKVSATGEIRLPAGPGKADIQASKVSWQGAPEPLSGRVKAQLARRRLDAQIELTAADLGGATAKLVVRTPADLTDPAGWKRLRAGAVESLSVKADKLDLARLVHNVGPPGTARQLRSALVELDLTAGRALETGKLTLNVTGAEVATSTDLSVPVTLNIEAALARAAITATVRADAGDQGKLDLQASVAVPADPLDAASWSRQGLDLIQSARIRVTELNLDRLERLRGKPTRGRTLELTGAVEAEITAGRGARSMNARVLFRDVRGVKAGQPVSGQFTAEAKPGQTDLALTVRLGSGPLLDGKLQIGVGADDLRGLDFAHLERRVRAATLRGKLSIPNQPVVRIASTVSSAPGVSGQIGGELSLSGTMARPILSAALDAPGFTAQGIRFDRLRIRASYRAGPWTASINARQADGGRVLLEANGSPSKTAPLKVHLEARRLRLGLFTPLWKQPGSTLTHLQGTLQGDLDISGSTERPIIDGTLAVRQGEARIARFLRPVTAATIDVRFRRSVASISVKASSRPGKIVLTGNLDMRRPAQARFTAQLKANRLPVEAGKQIVSINGNVKSSGALRGRMWDVDVIIDRGLVVRLPAQKGLDLHDSGPLDDVEFVDAAGAAQAAAAEELKTAAGPAMRLKIRSEDLVEVRSDEVAIDLRVQLTTTKVGGANVVDGSIEAVRGWVEIVSRRYTVERGWIIFNGEVPPDPRLDIRVGHQFPEAMVYIDVGGRVSAPEVTFASDSGDYDQAQLLGLVLGGNSSGGGDASQSDRASAAAAGIVANQVAGIIREAGLPVDVLRIGTDPESETEGQLSEVTVGKWINERLFVAYRYRTTVDQNKNQNEGTFQHFFTKDWMWEGVVGNRANSIDLLWIVPLGR
jgi:hypothetical protein